MEEKDNITQEIKNTDELVINDVETGEISQLLSKGSLGDHMMQCSRYCMVQMEDGTIQGLLKYWIYHM